MVQRGWDLLAQRVSTGALHNSNERRDIPKCHPGTRDQLIVHIMKWLDDVNDPQVVLWLKGSPGFGKSVIAAAIATLCSQEGRLLGGFFASGNAPMESGRCDEMKVVPTIVYQMGQNIPHIRSYIANPIEINPLVFDLTLADQIDKLIVGPLAIRSDEMSTPIPPMLIIVDAVDEFPDKSTQERIVQAFSEAMRQIRHQIPVKLFIASRAERTIQSALLEPQTSPLVRTISLDYDYPAHGDIRTFLVEGFSAFRRTHPSPDIFPLIWPAEEAIDELVKRSSGQFLYAAMLLNYMRDNEADPVRRLQNIVICESNVLQVSDFRLLSINSQHRAIFALVFFFF